MMGDVPLFLFSLQPGGVDAKMYPVPDPLFGQYPIS